MPHFVKDMDEIRQRAIRKIEEGAVTEKYGLDKEHTIDVLNEALATEIVCVLRYMHHYFMATGVHGKGVADEFKEHADAEREHADQLAERIQQLGGKPDFNPASLVQRSVSQYIEGESLADMIREDLIAERIVIDVYTDMIRFFGDKDPVTRIMIEKILADEEEHASDLSDLLYIVDPQTGKDAGQDPGTEPLQMERGRQEQGGRNQVQSRKREDGEERNDMAANDRRSGKSNQQGISNREATEELERGALKTERGTGRKSLNSRDRSQQEGRGSEDTRKTREDSGFRPERTTRSERPAAGRGADLETERTPGASGRPTRKRTPEIEDTAAGEVREGSGRGSNRAVRVTNPNRKNKKVA